MTIHTTSFISSLSSVPAVDEGVAEDVRLVGGAVGAGGAGEGLVAGVHVLVAQQQRPPARR